MPGQADLGIGAAIDIGSTSVHLLVSRATMTSSGAVLETLIDASDPLGLGERVDADGAFGPDAIDALVASLDGFLRIAAEQAARSIAIVATEPFRRASDAATAIDRVSRGLGHAIDVLDPEEEALCTLVGVTGGRRLAEETAVLDVGGGSTEVIIAGPRRDPVAFSVPLGAIRLTSTLVGHDPPTAAEVDALRAAAREAFADGHGWALSSLIAVGGTATNLGRVASGTGEVRPRVAGMPALPEVVGPALPERATDNGSGILTLDAVDAVLRLLIAQPAERIAFDAGIRPGRARILAAGAAILEAVLMRYGLPEVTVSPVSLREGLLLLVAEAGDRWRDRLVELAAGWA